MEGDGLMNGWLVLGAIVILWVFAFSLMYLSFWLEERREEKIGRQTHAREEIF